MTAFLTNAEIRNLAPAVFAEVPSATVSDRYAFASTIDAINIFRNEGYEVAQAKQDKSRLRNPLHAKHSIVLRHVDYGVAANVGEQVPQIILTNSHDTGNALSLKAGVFRLICSNGLIAGSAKFNLKLRHTGNLTDDLAGVFPKMAANMGELAAALEAWTKKVLTPAQQLEFAEAAAKIRWGANADLYEAGELLEATRAEDEGDNLWITFNKIQEACVKGGVRTKDGKRTSQTLASIKNDTDVNTKLWCLAESFV